MDDETSRKVAEKLSKTSPRGNFEQIDEWWFGQRSQVQPPHTRDLLNLDNFQVICGSEDDKEELSCGSEDDKEVVLLYNFQLYLVIHNHLNRAPSPWGIHL